MHETINGLVASYGYALLVVLVGLESFGIPLSGETALVTAGAFAALGRLNLAGVIIAAAAGAILGGNAIGWGAKAVSRSYTATAGTSDSTMRSSNVFTAFSSVTARRPSSSAASSLCSGAGRRRWPA